MTVTKSVDEVPQSLASQCAGAEPSLPLANHGPNPGRRRLMRGLAAAGPVILTLRSGLAVAQAQGSCTGIKTTLPKPSGEYSPATNDVCTKNWGDAGCPTGKVRDIQDFSSNSIVNDGSNWQCETGQDAQGNPVYAPNAIVLSAAGVNSIVGGA